MSRFNSGSFQYFIRETRQGQPTYFHRHLKARLLYYSINNLKSAKWFQIKNQFAGVLVGEIRFYILRGRLRGLRLGFGAKSIPVNDYYVHYKGLKVHFNFLENLEFMENTENSWKTRILSSFLFAVFTQTMPDGENRLDMIENIKLDWFLVIKSSNALPVIIKNTKNRF